eukprot:UN12492
MKCVQTILCGSNKTYEYKIWKNLPEPLTKYFFATCPPDVNLTDGNYVDHNILNELKPGQDYYSWILWTELTSMLYIFFFYEGMATKLQNTVLSSRYSGDMILWLVVQIIFLVCDRSAYLFRSLKFKLVTQYVTVFVWHYQCFVVWPEQKISGT